jgi:alpha-1,6-mannosyltransferase
MRAFAAIGVGLTGLTLLALWLLAPWATAEGAAYLRPPLVAVLAIGVAVYFLAVRLVMHRRLPAQAVWVVLGLAMAMRLAVLFTPPILSSDVYRYIWDGRVQQAGINPYLFVPADPALAGLRDVAIYPHINRADYAHTIYPPAAQVVFAAMVQVSQSVVAEKALMLGFEALAVACLLKLLAMARLPPERVVIYAWNPLTVWSFAGDGHVDAVSVALLAGALLLRAGKRDGIAGAVFGAAVLVKFLPVVVGPALWRRGGGWRLIPGGVAAVVALYACYVGAGWRVLGFLPGYRVEEGLDTGGGIWLLAGLQQLGLLPAGAIALYGALTLLCLGALALWTMLRTRPPAGSEADIVAVCGCAAILAAGVTVAVSPHYPWYFTWLALPSVIRPYRAVVWLSAAPVALYINPFDDWFLWPSLVYVPAIVLVLADLRRAWRPLPFAPSLKGIS